jgi:hypothetical protein
MGNPNEKFLKHHEWQGFCLQLAELLAGDPELDKLSDDVICPVCLDLLHEPFQVIIFL